MRKKNKKKTIRFSLIYSRCVAYNNIDPKKNARSQNVVIQLEHNLDAPIILGHQEPSFIYI